MVGRTKPQKIMDSKLSSDLAHIEITYLKSKNTELAKALAECKATLTQVVEERDILQRELFSSNLRCAKTENVIKLMQNFSRACMTSIVTASTHTTQLLETAHNALNVKSRLDGNHSVSNCPISRVSPNTSNKTQAVKPMIGGHVILRPTINLRRVNEFSHEELQRLQSNSSLNNSNNSLEDANQNQNNEPYVRLFRNQLPDEQGPSFSNNQENEYNDPPSSESDGTPEGNERLDTVQEEVDEDLEHPVISNDGHLNSLTNGRSPSFNISGNNSQVPLLSGVFRDVRVYLSPMQNLDPHQHVTTERGSNNKRHKTQRSHSMSSMQAQEEPSAESRNLNFSRSSDQSAESRNLIFNRSSLSPGDDSYTALQNSLMSSSKASTPNNINLRRNKLEKVNWINMTNKRGSPSCKRPNGDSPASCRSSPRVLNGLRQLRDNSLTSAEDPLEGPSTLLDNDHTVLEDKIEVMNGLGLIPTFVSNNQNSITPQKSEPATPPTPGSAVARRRERRSKIEKKKAVLMSGKTATVIVKRIALSKTAQFVKRKSISPKKPNESTKKTKTPKRSDRNKQKSISSNRNAKVSKGSDGDKKKSISPKRNSKVSKVSDGDKKKSISPKRNSKESKKRKVSPKCSPPKRSLAKLSLDSSLDQKDLNVSSSSSTASTITSEKPKKRKKLKLEPNTCRASNTRAANSPLIKRRPRRTATNQNFKEPSLLKKLRRSK